MPSSSSPPRSDRGQLPFPDAGNALKASASSSHPWCCHGTTQGRASGPLFQELLLKPWAHALGLAPGSVVSCTWTLPSPQRMVEAPCQPHCLRILDLASRDLWQASASPRLGVSSLHSVPPSAEAEGCSHLSAGDNTAREAQRALRLPLWSKGGSKCRGEIRMLANCNVSLLRVSF